MANGGTQSQNPATRTRSRFPINRQQEKSARVLTPKTGQRREGKNEQARIPKDSGGCDIPSRTPPECRPQQPGGESECCSIVQKALDAVGRIKKDTKRADIEKEFVQDGGIFSRSGTIYRYKLCPYIKVRVVFALDPAYKGFADGSPKDTANSVSKPYVEYGTSD
jgi:hypothetical protein